MEICPGDPLFACLCIISSMSKQYEWDEAEGFAELYERLFVPALFAEWGELTISAASIVRGERVLDVACGTGVIARAARTKTDQVVGLDFNDDMLSVARSLDSSIDWQKGNAQELPFDANSFDVVVSQFALMFFPDKVAALKEMKRVGRRVVVTVWEELDRTPGYKEFVKLLNDEFGTEPADILTSPFILGDKKKLAALFDEAGLVPEISTRQALAKFPSLEAWITTDIRATPLSRLFDAPALSRLIELGNQTLSIYEDDDGTISFPTPAHIVTCV